MALKKNFKINTGLEVSDSVNISGALTAAGLSYPTADGTNQDVLKTDGQGNLTFGRIRISEIEDVLLDGLINGGLLQYDSARQKWVVSTELDTDEDQNLTTDGGFY